MICPHCQTEITAAALANLPKIKNTDAAAQEAALLEALREAGPVGLTTDDLRAAGFYQAPARLWALRHTWGAVIRTELYDGIGADNVYHCRMARYRLVSEPLLPPTQNARRGRQKPAEATNGGEAVCR